MLEYLPNVFMVVLLVLGFGFVIFWHELGHFLAAKWVGIKVEQFAVGFGQAILAWRKGIGFRVGTTRHEYERRIHAHLDKKTTDELQLKEKATVTSEQMDKAADELGLGETEYRLNWIPLGGYVKMLEQDDLKQIESSGDPRAYPNKSVGARMFVISAGVIMNIILAAIGFMALFMMGHRVPPAQVAGLYQGSPAQNVTRTSDGSRASLQVGDTILYYDEQWMWDWTKVGLSVALSEPNVPTPIHVRHADGTEESFRITPAMEVPGSDKFLTLGLDQAPPRSLKGFDPKKIKKKITDDEKWTELVTAEQVAVMPGEAIVAVNGQPLAEDEYYKFDREVQEARGKPVEITVRKLDGKDEAVKVQPHFQKPFGETPLNFAGLVPRARVASVIPESPARGKLLPGDAIVKLVIGTDPKDNPSGEELRELLNKAGQAGVPVDVTVLRPGQDQPQVIAGVKASMKLPGDAGGSRYGIGIGLSYDEAHPVAGAVLQGSPAAAAGIPEDVTVTQVGGKPVASWFDVQAALEQATAGQPLTVAYKTRSGAEETKELTLSADQLAFVRGARYQADVAGVLDELIKVRKADNPGQAAWWGVTETRDFVLQFYVTIQRMIGGSVSPKNLMGPVGIFQHGAGFAFKGPDWLIWFLAMISANLAVVNFLPIPVVDGGHFVFLLVEKFRGKPLSPKVQSVAQIVGLALLLGIFLFVTYQDIGRMLTPG